MRHHQSKSLVISVGAAITLAAVISCSDGSGPAPVPLTVDGVYYGSAAWSASSCTPSVPNGFDSTAFTQRRLIELTQTGSQLTGVDSFSPGSSTFRGTIALDGSVTLVERFSVDLTSVVRITGEVVYMLAADSNGTRLHGRGEETLEFRSSPENMLRATCTGTIDVDLTQREAAVELPAMSCDQESSLRSQNDFVPSILLFRNGSPRTIQVYWLSYTGTRSLFFTLAPTQKAAVNAFASHPWVVTDADTGQCIAIYTLGDDPATVTLR